MENFDKLNTFVVDHIPVDPNSLQSLRSALQRYREICFMGRNEYWDFRHATNRVHLLLRNA